LEFPYHVALSTDIGRSQSSTDTASSWNQMYGISWGDIRNTGLQLDLRYTKFNSSFGQGTYQFVSLSRNLAERLRVQLRGGVQHLNSSFSSNSNSRFVTGTVDWTIGPRYFFEGLYSWNTGSTMSYRQMNLTFGYRFGGFRPK
jgi:outer membrane usher protein FimD/PapC